MVGHLFLRCGGMTLGFIRKHPMQTVLKRLQYGLHGMLTLIRSLTSNLPFRPHLPLFLVQGQSTPRLLSR